MMFGGGIFMIIFWIAVIVLIAWVVRSLNVGHRGGHNCCALTPDKKPDDENGKADQH